MYERLESLIPLVMLAFYGGLIGGIVADYGAGVLHLANVRETIVLTGTLLGLLLGGLVGQRWRLKRSSLPAEPQIASIDVIASTSAMLQVRPDDVALYKQRAMTYLQRQENDKAIADFDRLLGLEPDNGEGY